MLPTTLFVILLAALAIAGGTWIWLRSRGRWPLFLRVLLVLTPLSGTVATFRAAGFLFISPRHDWNAGKLAPVVAMTKGYRLYQDPGTGVMTAWIYGPVPALLLLPAAVAKTPTSAILIAEFINLLIVMSAAVWLIFSASTRQTRGMAALAFLAFVWITGAHESLRRAVYMLGPDAPTLAFITCAIAVLSRNPASLLRMSIAAACAVLACWCKQSALPVLIVFPLYVGLAKGWIAGVTQAMLIGIAGVIVSCTFILSFGASNMWFHMVALPAAHGWRGEAEAGRFWAFWSGVQDLAIDLTPTLGGIGVLLLIERYLLPGAKARDLREWFGRNPWSMLVLVAIVLVPSAILGYVKIGGYLNNLSLSHFFLALLAAVLLIRLYARALTRSAEASVVAPVLVVLACAAVLWPLAEQFLPKHAAEDNFLAIAHTRDNEQEIAYNFAKKNPQIGYFPWNNLSTLLADGKLYHFAWGYTDRFEAKLPPSHEQIRRHLPEKMQLIGFGPRRQDETTLQYLPTPPYVAKNDQLPGFTLYVYPEPLKPGGW